MISTDTTKLLQIQGPLYKSFAVAIGF